eukprot:2126706-Pleurochrysis_carterae.AAC.1
MARSALPPPRAQAMSCRCTHASVPSRPTAPRSVPSTVRAPLGLSSRVNAHLSFHPRESQNRASLSLNLERL